MIAVALDSGALSAWADGDRRILAALEVVRQAGGYVVVPTVAVAESTTGQPDRDATVNRRLKAAALDTCPEERARRAAALRFGSGRAEEISVVDAIVIATGEAVGARVITGDPDDLRVLADVSGRVDVVAVGDLV